MSGCSHSIARRVPTQVCQPLTGGFSGIFLSESGKQRNGLPGLPNTGLNPPFTTFSTAKQSRSFLCAVVQSIGGTIPFAVYFFVALSALMTFARVKFGPAALSPVTNSSALIQPTSEFSFVLPSVFLIHVLNCFRPAGSGFVSSGAYVVKR